MFTSFVVHAYACSANDEYALNYRFELFYDMDAYLETHHSLAGCSGISPIDIMLFSYLRRFTELKHTDCLKEEILDQAMPELTECSNLTRLVTYIAKTFQIGYDSMDKKEKLLYQKVEWQAGPKLPSA